MGEWLLISYNRLLINVTFSRKVIRIVSRPIYISYGLHTDTYQSLLTGDSNLHNKNHHNKGHIEIPLLFGLSDRHGKWESTDTSHGNPIANVCTGHREQGNMVSFLYPDVSPQRRSPTMYYSEVVQGVTWMSLVPSYDCPDETS